MDSQKLQTLLQDEKFIEVLKGAKTKEEVQEVFKLNGINISDDEVNTLIDSGKKALEDGSLENVVGGGFSDKFKQGFKKGITGTLSFKRGGKAAREAYDPDSEVAHGRSYDEFMAGTDEDEAGDREWLINYADELNGQTLGSVALCGSILLAGAGLGVGATLLVNKLRKKK